MLATYTSNARAVILTRRMNRDSICSGLFTSLAPIMSQGPTLLCRNWGANGTCHFGHDFGARCHFAHLDAPVRVLHRVLPTLAKVTNSVSQGQPTHQPPSTQSSACRNFSTPAGCRFGDTCRFSHTMQAPAPMDQAQYSAPPMNVSSADAEDKGVPRVYETIKNEGGFEVLKVHSPPPAPAASRVYDIYFAACCIRGVSWRFAIQHQRRSHRQRPTQPSCVD